MPKSVLRYTPNSHLLLVPPFPKLTYVFTKDLKQLIADLGATDDKLAVVQRYEGALAARFEVSCNFRSGFGSVVFTCFEVCANVGKAGKDGEIG